MTKAEPELKTCHNSPQLDPSDCCKASSVQVSGGFCPFCNVSVKTYNNIPFHGTTMSKQKMLNDQAVFNNWDQSLLKDRLVGEPERGC